MHHIVEETPTVKPNDDLPALEVKVRALHREVLRTSGSALDHALDAGDVLIAAHAKLAHGSWAPWLHKCGLKARTARRYIQLAKARTAIEA
jgi:hypothetical protein